MTWFVRIRYEYGCDLYDAEKFANIFNGMIEI